MEKTIEKEGGGEEEEEEEEEQEQEEQEEDFIFHKEQLKLKNMHIMYTNK